jgi:hypothetical protein
VLTSYPRHHPLEDLAHFDRLMEQDRDTLDVERARAWIARNAGPMPASAMPDRVVTVVEDLVRMRRVQGDAACSSSAIRQA